MNEAETIAFRVLEQVLAYGPVQLEELGRLLPHYTWNQMFTAVDRFSRDGRLALYHPDRNTYIVAIHSVRDRRSGLVTDHEGLPNAYVGDQSCNELAGSAP